MTYGWGFEILFCLNLLDFFLPNAKPLSPPKHSLTAFSFKSRFWAGQFSHCRHVKAGRGTRSYPGHCRWWPWAGLFAVLAKLPCDQSYGLTTQSHKCTSWRDQGHNLNSPSKMPHVFKTKMSVFQVMTLTKRQKHSLPGFCYGFN
jgi:hypothetical protein